MTSLRAVLLCAVVVATSCSSSDDAVNQGAATTAPPAPTTTTVVEGPVELLLRSELPFEISDDGEHVFFFEESQYYIARITEIPDRVLIEAPDSAVRYPSSADPQYNGWSQSNEGVILHFGSGAEGDRNEIELFRVDGEVDTIRRPSVGAQFVSGEFSDGSYLLWRYPFEGVDDATTALSRMWPDGRIEEIETTDGSDLGGTLPGVFGDRVFGFASTADADAVYPTAPVPAAVDGAAFWLDPADGVVNWIPEITLNTDDPFYVSGSGTHFLTHVERTVPIRPWFGPDRRGRIELGTVDSSRSIQLVMSDGEEPDHAVWSPSGDRVALGFGVKTDLRDAPIIRIFRTDDVLAVGGLEGVEYSEVEIDAAIADELLGSVQLRWTEGTAMRLESDQVVYRVHIPG